ncbi:hypothetical protein [Pararhizobium sp.]|uniref:hypothetical protein n=1 Tax=Pararhizobium sp. TaxID=1977563 RepID=UPI003D115078
MPFRKSHKAANRQTSDSNAIHKVLGFEVDVDGSVKYRVATYQNQTAADGAAAPVQIKQYAATDVSAFSDEIAAMVTQCEADLKANVEFYKDATQV